MLPKVHHQRYQKFKQALEQLQQTVAGVQVDVLRLRQSYFQLHQLFQQQIVSLDASDLEPADEPKVRSYQTEMSKQLQLLGMDVMFLQAARQSETLQQRQVQLSDRLVSLLSYCDVLLELN